MVAWESPLSPVSGEASLGDFEERSDLTLLVDFLKIM